MAEDWIGRVVDGRYVVDAVLGRGGMGVVLRAKHKFTGGTVALKLLHAELHMDPALEARFLAEARASNQIGHPAIVQVLDAGRTPDGVLYLVMEYLAGDSLRAVVHQKLAPGEIKRIGHVLLDALSAAHARGFVHRDLKPENVFITSDGAVKLLDFGIAKGMTSATTGPARTEAGALLGTLAYMAPEQLRDASTVDSRADLWAIGVMLYELVSGRLPFEGSTIEEVFVKLATAPPDPITRFVPTISPVVEVFFNRALAREPAARFQTAQEMMAALAQLPLDAHVAQVPAHSVAIGPSDIGSYVPRSPLTGPVPLAQSPQTGPVPLAALTPVPTGPFTPVPGGPHIPSQAQITTAPITRVEPSNRRGVVLLIGAVLISGLLVAGAVAIKHSRSIAVEVPKDAPVQTAIVVDAGAVPDAAQIALVPIDAGVAKPTKPKKVDAGVGSATPIDPYAGTQPPPNVPNVPIVPTVPIVPIRPVIDCVAQCKWLANSCYLPIDDCTAKCEKDAIKGCLPARECNAAAACMLKSSCGAVNGSQSCNGTLACQEHCAPNDPKCFCHCTNGLNPAVAADFLSYNKCTQTCGADTKCKSTLCDGAYRRCMAH
ncbi:MAG: protein kinase [Kofleriaceae bacterium]